MLLLIKKHKDTLLEERKSKPKETLEFNSNKQMETFSFNLPINLSEEGKLLLAVTYFGATNYVFKIPDENNNVSCGTTVIGEFPTISGV